MRARTAKQPHPAAVSPQPEFCGDFFLLTCGSPSVVPLGLTCVQLHTRIAPGAMSPHAKRLVEAGGARLCPSPGGVLPFGLGGLETVGLGSGLN